VSLDAQTATRTVPGIVMRGDASTACDLLRSEKPREQGWLAEGLALLATPGLDAQAQREMLLCLMPGLSATMDETQVTTLANSGAQLGMTGFSFPRWRFVAQGFGGSSLMERFRLTRLQRATDRFDPAQPPTPQNDRFGTGFISHDGAVTIEYRRAYVLIASRHVGDEATLVIRNSSWFFGRDRLDAPVYAAWQGLSPAQCEALAVQDFAPGGVMTPWTDSMTQAGGPPLPEKIRRTHLLLATFAAMETRMDQWLRGRPGRDQLAALIRHAEGQQRAQGRASAPFYLAALPANSAPWQPEAATPADRTVARALQSAQPQRMMSLRALFTALAAPDRHLALLSGPRGDFPLPPAP
jgi:hypothetical protein